MSGGHLLGTGLIVSTQSCVETEHLNPHNLNAKKERSSAPFPLFFTFIFENLFCDVNRAVFGLLKGSAHIFADNADAEKLNGAQQ